MRESAARRDRGWTLAPLAVARAIGLRRVDRRPARRRWHAPPERSGARPRYPDFVFPRGAADLRRTRSRRSGSKRGWAVPAGRRPARRAARVRARRSRPTPAFYPADAGLAYARLAPATPTEAEARFDRALARTPGTCRPSSAAATRCWRSAAPTRRLPPTRRRWPRSPTSRDVQRRLETLRVPQPAGRAADGPRGGGGRAATTRRVEAYERAIAGSPDSAFLYRELAVVERRQGDRTRALEHLRRAADARPRSTRAPGFSSGSCSTRRGDFAGAVAAYEEAAALDPGADVRRTPRTARRGRRCAPPGASIAKSPRSRCLTRGQLAALIGVRLGRPRARPASGARRSSSPTRAATGPRPGCSASCARASWTATRTTPSSRARRSRRLDVAARRQPRPRPGRRCGDPALARSGGAARPAIADVPLSHLGYPAASVAVASGVMRLQDGTFRPARPLTGAEAIAVIGRLEELAR